MALTEMENMWNCLRIVSKGRFSHWQCWSCLFCLLSAGYFVTMRCTYSNADLRVLRHQLSSQPLGQSCDSVLSSWVHVGTWHFHVIMPCNTEDQTSNVSVIIRDFLFRTGRTILTELKLNTCDFIAACGYLCLQMEQTTCRYWPAAGLSDCLLRAA
jgi:hypothetical protein